MKKIYYQITLIQKSPLRIGNGRHELSDSDLMLDGRGLPFIPGTSLAGIIRHCAESISNNETVINRIFGMVEILKDDGKEADATPSAIIIGDAVMRRDAADKDAKIYERDGVGLGEWGTAKKTSKFDFQISESEKELCSIVEWTGDVGQKKAEIDEIIDPIMKNYIASGLSAGARTSRGYGKFDVKVKKKIFTFPEDLDSWLEFNPYAEGAFEEAETLAGKAERMNSRIGISFKMLGTFSIRVNTARTELLEDGSVPDTVPMENYKNNPVIPGTVWAGVFRHHMHDLLRDTGVEEDSVEMKELDMLFGMSDCSGESRKSVLSFSESEICIKDKDNQKMSVMRTAIDRFTGSPKTAALFTNMVYSGGEGKLFISFDKNALSDKYRELLAACICDMHAGLITVGGEASVGRGIMQVIGLEIDGHDKFNEMKFSIEKAAALNWLKEETENE